mgnify:CR=1 FL=1
MRKETQIWKSDEPIEGEVIDSTITISTCYKKDHLSLKVDIYPKDSEHIKLRTDDGREYLIPLKEFARHCAVTGVKLSIEFLDCDGKCYEVIELDKEIFPYDPESRYVKIPLSPF